MPYEDAIMNNQKHLVEAKMANIRGWELIIILVIVLLLFGPGRLSRIAGEIGRGIREFRSGIKDGDDEADDSKETEKKDEQGS
jgi:sec-independent protein translocase protein TatA